eukprot:5030652-Prymnesium_polylepis.1
METKGLHNSDHTWPRCTNAGTQSAVSITQYAYSSAHSASCLMHVDVRRWLTAATRLRKRKQSAYSCTLVGVAVHVGTALTPAEYVPCRKHDCLRFVECARAVSVRLTSTRSLEHRKRDTPSAHVEWTKPKS